MINRLALYRDCIRCEKEAGVTLTVRIRNLLVDEFIRHYYEMKSCSNINNDKKKMVDFLKFIDTNNLLIKESTYNDVVDEYEKFNLSK